VNAIRFKKFRTAVLKSHVLPILNLIKRLYETGESYPTKIGRLLGLSPKLAWYYINKLEKLGYIRTEVKTPIKIVRLTSSGQNFLERIETSLFSRSLRLERVVFKYPIIEEPKVVIDWRKVQLRNWGQLLGRECGVFVRKNPKSLEVFCEPVSGDNPWELYHYARLEADFVARRLEQKFEMKLGIPEMARRPEFAIYDPVAREFTKFFDLKDDVARIDRSPPKQLGEIDWLSPEMAKEYLLTPLRLRSMEKTIQGILESLKTFERAMQEHLKLIKSLQDVVESLKKVRKPKAKKHRKRKAKNVYWI